jgi:adenylylsulfate kinase-like enzyme
LQLKKNFLKKNFILVDGDMVREVFDDLGYEEKDRFKQITRMQNIAYFLNKQGFNVIVAALFSHPKLLSKNRKIFSKYFEIYLKANIDFLLKRENKNLYSRALSNKLKNVVGIDIKWNPPKKPNIIFDQSLKFSTSKMINKIKKKIKL